MGLSKMAFSLTADAGCQYGGGIQCTGAPSKNKSAFVGWMLYDRMWFHKDLWGLTPGGGEISNWYRRVLEERVEKITPKSEWQKAYRDIADFERTLADDGYAIVKLFF